MDIKINSQGRAVSNDVIKRHRSVKISSLVACREKHRLKVAPHHPKDTFNQCSSLPADTHGGQRVSQPDHWALISFYNARPA